MAIVAETAATLKGAARGGLIREDVMEKIFNISPIDLPFLDMVGTETSKNPYKEWTTDELKAPKLDNAVVDGTDPLTTNDAAVGKRMGNHHQISLKVVQVSDRAQETDNIGRSDELAYQLMLRQRELKKDMEATLLSLQASEADDGNTTAGKLGALGSWIKTNIALGGTGTAGGFNETTGKTVSTVPGTKVALTETAIRDAMEKAYIEGGDPRYLMSTPGMIRKISEYLFTSSARIATLQTDVSTGDVKRVRGNADDLHQGVTAIGSVNVLVTDFGTLTLIPNRFQQPTAAGIVTVYGLDPEFLAISYLHNIRGETLAKTGLADKRALTVDYTLVVKQEKAQFALYGVDSAAAVTA